MNKSTGEFFYYTQNKEDGKKVKVREDMQRFYSKLHKHIKDRIKKEPSRN